MHPTLPACMTTACHRQPNSPPTARLQAAFAAMGLGLAMALGTVNPVQAQAHEHGVVRLSVAVDGAQLSVAIEAPLDNLLGFERAPRTEAERQAAAAVLARFKSPAGLLTPDAAAQCTLATAEVLAPVLQAQPAAAGKPPAAKAAASEHADLDANYSFTCARPDQLANLALGLFDSYRRIQRIEVQVAGASGQRKLTLRRPAKLVPLGR